MRGFFTFALLICLTHGSPHGQVKTPIKNMNGDYIISNANPASDEPWSGDYAKYEEVEYFDVYSPPISSRYGEVFWTMMDPVPLDKEIVDRFNGKAMAVVGYETDQVMRTETGDVSVPIIWAYNHHYCAYLSGAMSEMREFHDHADLKDIGMNNHGASTHYLTFKREDIEDENADTEIPTSQFISEGNGGEFRKSYHGYPKGFAQLIESPTTFHIQPMQIDTKNRHYNGSDFRADLLPKASAAPPNASYSGLLECPCTERIVKKIEHSYNTQAKDTCDKMVDTAEECFEAAVTVDSVDIVENITVNDDHMPRGCSIIHHSNDSVVAYFNTKDSKAKCGGGNTFTGYLHAEAALTNVKIDLSDLSQNDHTAKITLSGPNGKWFSVGLNSPKFAMSDQPYTIVVDGKGNISERKIGNHDAGTVLARSIHVVSNSVTDGVRTVVMSRDMEGKTTDHYSFDTEVTTIPVIIASGSGPLLGYHGPKTRTGGNLQLAAVDYPTCICSGGVSGSINGVPFHKDCRPEPYGDLLQQKNPSCWVDTYQGGLQCCHHQNILLDKDQEQPEEVLTYHMKFRFYYQTYTPATPSKAASHNNLIRMWHQTEENSGEYDVVGCPAGTPPQECVYQITSHFTVQEMVQECDVRKQPTCWGNTTDYDGIHLIYAAGHCHAPSCLSMELYNADTGMLLCAHNPVYGKTHEVFDELGYVTIPPCLWGPEEEGLVPPTFLPFNANLTSIKRNNNTNTHYGEMAMWQMRGVMVRNN